jgi:hypothetical protein
MIYTTQVPSILGVDLTGKDLMDFIQQVIHTLSFKFLFTLAYGSQIL